MLYSKLKEQGISGRRYFYPLISSFPMYKGLPSARHDILPAAESVAGRVLCLPIYAELGLETAVQIAGKVKNMGRIGG